MGSADSIPPLQKAAFPGLTVQLASMNRLVACMPGRNPPAATGSVIPSRTNGGFGSLGTVQLGKPVLSLYCWMMRIYKRPAELSKKNASPAEARTADRLPTAVKLQ